MNDDHCARIHAWAISRFPPEDLLNLCALIRCHDRCLQALGGPVVTAAVLDAVLVDAAAGPSLAAALRRANQMDLMERKRRAAEI